MSIILWALLLHCGAADQDFATGYGAQWKGFYCKNGVRGCHFLVDTAGITDDDVKAMPLGMLKIVLAVVTISILRSFTLSLPATTRRQMLGKADPEKTCLGHQDFGEICCKNCTACCEGHNRCNFGTGNRGVGNLGSFNYGDFNMANGSRGDCNLVDDAWGIGGPEYRGCPQELQDHIVRYCAINPRYYKCGFPPYSFGEELSEKLRNVVLACDSGIPVRDKSKLRAMLKRRAKQKRVLEKVKVAKKPRKFTQKDLRPD